MATVRNGRPARGKALKRPRRDPDNTRSDLLASATELFARKGYDATSVQEIVDEAGRTKGAFYHYFESKEDLLLNIHDRFIDFQLERGLAVMSRGDRPDVALRNFIVEVLMEPMGMYMQEITIYLQEQRFFSDKAFAEIRVKRDAFANQLVDIIQQGLDEGVFRNLGPARVMAFGVIGMCAWTHTWMAAAGKLSAHDIGSVYADLAVGGLLA